MALTTTPGTSLGAVKTSIFEEDDEETWSLLVSLSSDSPDITDRLKSLAERLEADLNAPADFWDGLCKKVHSVGFSYSSGPLKTGGFGSGGNGNNNNDYPVAFQSEPGKKHLKAVSSALGLSEDRAVKITMSALRSVNSEGSQFQSLLGSRDLLVKTMLHHYHQRSARLSVLTECLRLEQDPETLQRDAIVRFLDSLDSATKDGDRDRGLYRRLLTVACAPESTPTRDELEPCKALHDSSPRSLQDAIHVPQGEKGWHSFVATCLEERRLQTNRERTEAMEALLVLLYERINGGVRRADYAVLLTAFNISFNFFTEKVEGNRLSILAGLICAESMTLWRAFSEDADTNVGWASQHPLLLGMENIQAVQVEIENLKTLLQEVSTSLSRRQAESMASGDSPEALALLSFGLLLSLASANGFDSLKAIGSEMAMSANDTYSVFDYMQYVIHALTDKVSKVSSTIAHDAPYDWQFSDLSKPLLLENQPGKDAGADTVAYTSITREVLAAAIATFGSSILSSLDNVSMLCNLAYKLYQNNDMLCDQFWSDWESYSSLSTSTSKFPMCSLMDSAYKLAISGLESVNRDYRAGEEFLSKAAPFFRLLASLARDPTVVETTMAVLPNGMIRKALLRCRSEALISNDSFNKNKIVLLEAFSALTRVGNSQSCLDQLRALLEDEYRGNELVDGPRVLARILTSRVSADEAKPVLQTMAHLLQAAPQRWVLQLAQEIIVTDDKNYGLVAFLAPGSDAAHSAALILAELIEHFTAVVFCESFVDESAVAFLHLLENGLLSSTSMLASSLSVATSSLTGRTPLSFETAQTILQAFADFLKGIRSVARIHKSEYVRATAVQVRDNLINALATSTSWGHAIAYYAVAPVSLTLLIRLQHVVDDQKILQASGKGDESLDEDSKMGAWQSVLNPQTERSGGNIAKASLLAYAEEMTLADFDLEGIQARGWTNGSDDVAPINAAWSAIRLLSGWASHVEDIAESHLDQSEIGSLKEADSKTKDLILNLSPQRLLTSLASSPVPCWGDSSLSSIWQEAGLSHFDLLLPYLSQAEKGGSVGFASPSSATLDFLQACVAHIRSGSPPETVADSMLFRAIYRSDRLTKLMKGLLERSIAVSAEGDLGPRDKTAVSDGLLSLRIVSSCSEASASVADKLLHLDAGDLVPALVEAACKGHKVLAASDSSRNIFETEGSVVQLRLAAGCLEVLSSLWKVAFRSLQVREDSIRSRLCKVVEEQRALVTVLVTVVGLYANGNLESSIVSSWISEHARCTMTMFVSTALDILTTEVAYSVCAPAVSVNDALKNLLLVDFLKCDRFGSYEGFLYAAERSAMGIHSRVNSCQLTDILKCFPSTSSQYCLNDVYSNENAFDIASSIRILKGMGSKSIDDVEDVMSKIAISYQTTLCELQIMASWKSFAESMVIFYSGQFEEVKTPPNKERLFEFAQATMTVLCQNVVSVEKSHGEATEGFMKHECVQMVSQLSNLFLFFLELVVGGSGNDFLPPTVNLLNLLDLVIRTSEAVFSLISADAARGSAPSHVLQTCCTLQSPLMASAIVILGLIQSRPTTSMEPFKNRQDSSYNSMCRVNGKVLGVVVDLIRSTNKDGDVTSISPEHRDLLRCCISLSASLVVKDQESRLSESRYYNLVAETFQEYEVLPRLLQLGISSSRLAVSAIAKEKEPNSKPSKTFLSHKNIVRAILSLLCSVAETNDHKMMGILPKVLLAQFVVRNPLFSFASTKWARRDSNATSKRGYIIVSGSRQPATQNGPSAAGHFHIGINDPVHELWLAALKFMQAALRSSSCWLSPQVTEPSSSVFFDVAIEFLCTHRETLLACLQSTGTKLTRNIVLEATHTLSLVAELCKRDIRDNFVQSHQTLCQEFVDWAKYTVVSISKFLAASGTSRELFLAIEEYESSDSEEMTDELLLRLRSKHRHPLLAEGLPSAKHEAVKYSHFASRFFERVTESDFKDASLVPGHLKKLAKDREHESDLERNCRLSVTCTFALDMEKTSADCLSQAISLIWRVHPVSFSFHPFSEAEVQNMDAMMIVRPGVIIGFRPNAGEGLLEEYGKRTQLFKSLRFGRVRGGNTVKRTWEVETLRRSGEETFGDATIESVAVRQLAGIEDAAMRKAVTLYRPAPNSMTALETGKGVLSVGDLMLILRWCHQESLSKPGDGQSQERSATGSVRLVAEQTVALLGAELAMHEEIGSPDGLSKGDRSRMDAEIFELFADENILSGVENAENALPVRNHKTGRLVGIVDTSSLKAVRPQVEPGVRRAWQVIQDKERRRREKRTFPQDTSWFSSSVRRGSYSKKSAFRGLG